MAAILLHGVPETSHVWDPVLSRLNASDVAALSLPGFLTPRPAGFAATKEEFVAWIIGEIERRGSRVDLVGHDWGFMLACRVASMRPELVRTLCGGSGPISADYEWHPLARIWQTPGQGEAFFARFDPPSFAQRMIATGVPEDAATADAERLADPLMQDTILRLYRSALTVGKEWEPGLANIIAPTLVFWGETDGPAPIEVGERMARALRAPLVRLPCGHFTPVERPDEVAKAITDHWLTASGGSGSNGTESAFRTDFAP